MRMLMVSSQVLLSGFRYSDFTIELRNVSSDDIRISKIYLKISAIVEKYSKRYQY